MSSILDHFIIRLSDHYKRMGVDFQFKLIYDKEFVKQVMQKFFRIIETHAKERLKLKTSEVSIVHHKSFICTTVLIQRSLFGAQKVYLLVPYRLCHNLISLRRTQCTVSRHITHTHRTA